MVTIPYQCNRAVIFVSDQYHESLPFRFAQGYDNRRVNLTLVVVPLFITAMLLVMTASICFLREVRMASAHINRLF